MWISIIKTHFFERKHKQKNNNMSRTVTVGDALVVKWRSDGEEYVVDVVEVLCADSNQLKCCLRFRDEIEGDNPRVVKLYKTSWRKLEPSSANADEPPTKKKKTTPKEDQTDNTFSFWKEATATAQSDNKDLLDDGQASMAHASLVSDQAGEKVIVGAGFPRDADQLSGLPVKGMVCVFVLSTLTLTLCNLAGSSQNQDAERTVEDVVPAPQVLQDVSISVKRLERKIEVIEKAIGCLKEGMDWAGIKIALMAKGYKQDEISPLLDLTVQDLEKRQDNLQIEKNKLQDILLESIKRGMCIVFDM